MVENNGLITWNYDSGNVKREEWKKDGLIHCVGAPAVIQYYESGQIQKEEYWQNGALHRDDEPAVKL